MKVSGLRAYILARKTYQAMLTKVLFILVTVKVFSQTNKANINDPVAMPHGKLKSYLTQTHI